MWSLCWVPFAYSVLQKKLRRRQPVSQALTRKSVLIWIGISLGLLWCPLPFSSAQTLVDFIQGLQFAPSLGLIVISLSVWCYLLQSFSPSAPQSWLSRAKDYLKGEALWPVITPIALIFYPTALGFGMWDPYNWGYQAEFTLTLALINLLLWFFSSRFWQFKTLALWLTTALLCHMSGIYESANFWDILIDPFVSLWGLGHSMAWLKRKIQHGEHAKPRDQTLTRSLGC
jgi:hypothetical protein